MFGLGIFEGRRPTLYIFDPELIKAITVRDFEHFVDRNTIDSREPRYLARSLLNLKVIDKIIYGVIKKYSFNVILQHIIIIFSLLLKGSEWKIVRSTITPSFSSARLKNMMSLIQQSSNQMVKFLQQYGKFL